MQVRVHKFVHRRAKTDNFKFMSSTIQISSISGTPPFNVYVSDFYGNNEVFLSTINDNVPPVVYLTLPSGFTNVPMVKVKIVDTSGCTISYDEICGPI